MPVKHRDARSFIAAVLSVLTISAQAMPEDRDQPIKITADSAERSEQVEETRYTGNVVLTQGSLRIEADSLVVHNNAADLIVATGAPATLKQTPEANKADVTASAQRIEYDRPRDQITLKQSAKIEQDGAVVTGAVINYQVAEQRVIAVGDSSSKVKQRVEVIIPPDRVNSDAPAAQVKPR